MAIIESEFTLTDLIDVESLQKIQDAFSDMSGIASMITDANGSIQTRPSRFTDFCQKYVRNTEEGRRRCHKCDKMNRKGGEGRRLLRLFLPCWAGGVRGAYYNARTSGRLLCWRTDADHTA